MLSSMEPLISDDLLISLVYFFFFNDTATTEIYTLSLHDALPISTLVAILTKTSMSTSPGSQVSFANEPPRSEEHTSELQSRLHLVCRLLLEKKKKNINRWFPQQKKKKTKDNA